VRRSCEEASLLAKPICFIEGPATFWKCAPDGKNWNNEIAGCQRNNTQ